MQNQAKHTTPPLHEITSGTSGLQVLSSEYHLSEHKERILSDHTMLHDMLRDGSL